MPTVTGEFSIDTFDAEPLGDDSERLARVVIGKTFTGGLVGTSVVHMTSARTAVEDSASYVALERVVGVIDDRAGSFVLMHIGTSDRGTQSLVITVAPDSGTGELAGLTGSLEITGDTEGGHTYGFSYDLTP